MISELMPSEVASVECWGDDSSASLFPEEASQMIHAVESRTKEFATARTCARRALQKLGLPAIPILKGRNGEPVWPAGVVGSITHCQGYRAAAVARQSEVLAIGIDAEIHEPLPADVLDLVAVERERAWLATTTPKPHWDRLLFSAKECAYKAWYAITGCWLGFNDVEIDFAPHKKTFEVHLLGSRPMVAGKPLSAFSGRYLFQAGLVLTAIVHHPQR